LPLGNENSCGFKGCRRYNQRPMMPNPFNDPFSSFLGPDGDTRAWLLNPFHPRALFCLLCVIIAMVINSLLFSPH